MDSSTSTDDSLIMKVRTVGGLSMAYNVQATPNRPSNQTLVNDFVTLFAEAEANVMKSHKTKMDEYVTLFLEAEEKENERHPPFHESVEDVQSLSGTGIYRCGER